MSRFRSHTKVALKQMTDSASSDLPMWLSFAVAVATILSAIFAGRSARSARDQAVSAKKAAEEAQKQAALSKAQLKEMQRQSDISLHAHRLEIYKEFLEFRFELKARAIGFNAEKLWSFWAQARLAEFYFNPALSTALNAIVDEGLKIQTLGSRIYDPQGADPSEIQYLRREANRIHQSLDATLDTLDEDIRKFLRLVPVEA